MMNRPALSAARAVRRARTPWIAVGLCLSALAAATPARAQSPGAPAATSPDAEVKKLYNQGVEALNNKQWDKAIEALLQAYQRKPLPQIAANLGYAEFMAGKYSDAIEHLSFYLREGKNISPGDRQAMQNQIAEAQAKIGMVTIRVDVDGAEVLVDSKKVGVSPLGKPAPVDPGSRTFEARKEGLPSARQVVEVAAGAAPVVELKLGPTAPPPPSGAEPHPEDEERWRTWATVGGLGLSVAGLGIGVGLTAAANAKHADAAGQLKSIDTYTSPGSFFCGTMAPAHKPQCDPLKETLRAADRLSIGAITGYAIGGVAAVGTAALLLWPKARSKPTGVLLAPTLGGVVMYGSF